jgi:hypothetical protein
MEADDRFAKIERKESAMADDPILRMGGNEREGARMDGDPPRACKRLYPAVPMPRITCDASAFQTSHMVRRPRRKSFHDFMPGVKIIGPPCPQLAKADNRPLNR